MAEQHISIAGTEWGARLKQYRDAMKFIITEGPQLLDKMSKMIDATPDPDVYTELEVQFGLQGGDGAPCWGELASVVTALKANPAEPGAQAGDAALLATKLKQFVDVVG